MHLLKVEGTKLVRDPRSGAIINQAKTGLDEYLDRRRGMESQKEEINKVKSEIADVDPGTHNLLKMTPLAELPRQWPFQSV